MTVEHANAYLGCGNLNCFLMSKLEHGMIVWPHEQDICPDTLYLEGEEIEIDFSIFS